MTEWLTALQALAGLTYTRTNQPLRSISLSREGWYTVVREFFPDSLDEHGDLLPEQKYRRFQLPSAYGPIDLLSDGP